MAFSPTRREEICRLARQISCQSLQLKDIVDNIYQRNQSPARPSSAAAAFPSNPPDFTVQQSVTGGSKGGGRRSSAMPQTGKDFSVNSKVTTGAPGRKGSTTQFLTVQVPVSMASQFMATQKFDDGEISARQSVSGSLGSDEGPKIPTTSHISRRPKPPPPPKPKAEEPEPEHPRPYEDDPIWEVWEGNMLRLIQLLKMLLQELRTVSDYTKIDEPTLMSAAGVVGSGVPLAEAMASDAFATKVAASSIIGGMHNRENVSNALSNPAPFPQLYAPPPKVVMSSEQLSAEPARERIDLSVYFRKLASQMDALTQSLKPNPFPPHAGAPMANRLIPLEENVGRLAHNLAGVSRAIARPVDPLDALMSSRAAEARTGGPAGQQMQVRAEATMDNNGEGLVSMANRANVSFQLDKSSTSTQPSTSAASGKGRGGVQCDSMAPLVASVNQLSTHMNEVQDLFRRAMGARPLPKRKEGLSISEEEDLRYCITKLTDNMAKMSRDLKKALDEHTVVPVSRLIDELDDEEEDC
ncbi:hypothetical protein HPB49_016494 [Dermacentor silvarum]|uniref:Uncharacterized protein n=1 Tax=Dermacentor silvarum TaxID=543639 RepID=A0ACB8DQ92_DERSI|nr:uncharacterized protein LOC119466232 isoform X1 [Dermacentor silvarum]KAH7974533.1 hypothetical protein HPB49_016494 [Dermacentor silvarum]